MNHIEKYYNKFNEDKRLLSRHGHVEFTITMQYIKKYLPSPCKILDVGAGTGRYSVALDGLGHDVTAVELVKKNLSVLKQNAPNIKAFQGNATNLKKFIDNSFDAVLLFGPMYHLFNDVDKLKVLSEAKRVTKPNGTIFIAYLLSDYAIIRHGFMDKNILDSIKCGKVDDNFNILSTEEDLYSYVSLEKISELNQTANLQRLQIISPDGPTDYIRQYINKLTDDEFKNYLKFVEKNSANPNTIGASSHVVDILKNTK